MAASTFRVVLTDTDGFEGIVARRFDLAVGSTIRVGRASRSTQKKDLMPDTHNVFIDSPVISRDHAVLSANADSGAARIFITDTKSMHGTFVNGMKLDAASPTQLNTGDVIQFGVNVNRNEEYFVARKYHFEATLLGQQESSYSRGFAVPESEEEDISGTPSPRQGSQSDPLTIDDSESESDMSDDHRHDVTFMGEGFIVEEDEIPESYQPADIDVHISDNVSIEEKYSDDEDSAGDYPSGDEDDLGNNSDNSDAEASMGDSAFGDSSDADPNDIEIDHKREVDVAGNHTAAEVPVVEDNVTFSAPWFPFHTSFGSLPSNSSSELRPMTLSSVMNNFQPPPPPLPPRPTTVRPSVFYRNELSANRPGWWPEEMTSTPNYMGTNHGDRPSLFSPAPPPIPTVSAAQEAEATTSLFGGPSSSFAPLDGCIQTPPPMPSSDVISSTPPPPNRRTKVSITEIVEDQPPTPTSVNSPNSGTKRKADLLELEEEEEDEVSEAVEIAIMSIQDSSLAQEPSVEQPIESVVTLSAEEAAQAAAIIAQRPKKQPKSILKKLRNTATYVSYGAAGAAGAFALLSCLPDTFFV